MPELNFKGKEFVRNHHLSVPHRPIEPRAKQSVGKPKLGGSLIIHGDNLHALKSLLPMYAGKVNCIYIDPPYNTGNEGWCYNDNVNSPQMQAWLKQNPVGVEDGLRHDKWCSMMWPRLVLLRELLAEDGVIFVSIDDNEQHHLRMMMDEIFGDGMIYAQLIVKSNPGGRDYGGIAQTHDYVLSYGKNKDSDLNLVQKDTSFTLFDDIGGFETRELRNRNKKFNAENRPNLCYPFYVNPNDSDKNNLYPISTKKKSGWVEVFPLKSQGVQTVWRWQKSTAQEKLYNLAGKKKRDKTFQIIEKYRKELKRERSILADSYYRNEAGTLILKDIFQSSAFDYPKSFLLLRRLIELGSNKESIILDSFAGSGTTAHAVLALNKEDGGNRKFILVECEDYADKITAERVRRVIKGVPNAKDESLQNGLGGEFTYCTLGDSVDMDKLLTGVKLPSFAALGALLFHTATHEVINPSKIDASKIDNVVGYLGTSAHHHLWLIYKSNHEFLKSNESALTLERAKKIAKSKRGRRRHLVFAPATFVSQRTLAVENKGKGIPVDYQPLPWSLYRVAGS